MNRRLTNAVRYVMDEWVPPVIRDSRWFMYPFYLMAYRGKNVAQVMDFKRLVHSFSEREYRDFYANLDTISRNRNTDLNEASIRSMVEQIPSDAKTLLDVGCGRGYFLSRVKAARPDLELVGCDVVDKLAYDGLRFVSGNVESLPFDARSFDVVTCSHTLEHIIHPRAAVDELKRVAGEVLFVAVPCQRYFYYTLDEHVNFYPQKEMLLAELGAPEAWCEKLQGDWLVRLDIGRHRRAAVEAER